MIKDVVVNLSVGANRDPACDYAISVARSFNAHLTGIAFAYDPVVPAASGWAAMPSEWIEGQRAQSMDVAKTAVAKFEEGCRVGLSAESRVVIATTAEAAKLFGRIARRFDLSIVRQNEPGKLPYERLLIEAALFDSGRPVVIVPYIQTQGLS